MAKLVKNLQAGDLGSIPVLGRSPGEGKGSPLQYSGLENSMDYIVHGSQSQTRLSDFHFGTVMAPLGVSFHLLIEDQGLVEVDLSAILDPSDSNWFMLCPRAVSFFQKLCLAPSLLFQQERHPPKHPIGPAAWDQSPPPPAVSWAHVSKSWRGQAAIQ